LREMLRLEAPLQPYSLARIIVETHKLRGDPVSNMKRLGKNLDLLLKETERVLQELGEPLTEANKRARALWRIRPPEPRLRRITAALLFC
jgi:hypothetical protein